jgi:putative ABC transport system permease protein
MATLLQDARYGVRTLAHRPMFALVAVITLALGIGANTAIFSVIRAVLLDPLPFREPSRLVRIWETRLDRGWTRASFTRANFWDLKARNRTFEGIGAFRGASMTLGGFEYPEQVDAGFVSAGFFRILGVTPVAGRTFVDEESAPGGDSRVVLLGHRIWRARFGADPAIVGRAVTLDGERYAVVGVLPPGTPWLDAADLFVPMVYRADLDRGSFELAVMGRLRSGVTMEAAQADLEAVCRQLAGEYPDTDRGMGVSLLSFGEWVTDDGLRRALWLLTVAVGVMLVIACVNLTNLFLARATGRSREQALRAALGASRGRLVRQVLTESTIVGLAGAAAGVGLALLLIRVLRWLDPGDIPRLAGVGVDAGVLGFTLAIACATGLVIGIAPALQTPRGDIVSSLREGERGVAGRHGAARLRSLLVGAEVALSLALLVGAGLLVRSFGAMLGVDRGFQTAHRLVAAISVPASYGRPRIAQLIEHLLARIEDGPGVLSVAAVSSRPLTGGNTGMGIAAAGAPDVAGDAVPWATWRMIAGDYFETMGVPILRGRTFTSEDEIGNPWRVVISRRVADLLWPGEDPIGRTIILWKGQDNDRAEVIGVVGDMRERGLAADPTLATYLPYRGGGWTPVQIVVHTAGEPASVVPLLRSALAAIDPNLPLADVQTLDEIVSESVASVRFVTMLLAAFAGVAMLLALAGVYGVLAYSVSRRTTEIGVRLALGASRGSVLRLVLAQGMRPVFVGVGIGLAGAFALSRLLASLLFGVTPGDPVTYAASAVALTLAGVLSCYLPARQTLAVDPVAALREDA